MSTALNNDVAPLWAWILVIVFGSALVILFLFWTVRCRMRRRRRQNRFDIEDNIVATRRLTLDRGRVVTKTSQTSLTGPRERRIDAFHTSQSSVSPERSVESKERTLLHYTELSPETPSANSSYNSPSDVHATIGHLKAPRISLSSFTDDESLSNFSHNSDRNLINKPSPAVVVEPQSAKAINFSRPQIRTSAPPKKNRLSVINEFTPRTSIISRIVSWASSSHESETKKPEMQQSQAGSMYYHEQTISSPRDYSSHMRTSAYESYTDLEQLIQDPAPAPDIPIKHPTRAVTPSNASIPSVRSRSSSIRNSITTSAKISHRRSDSSATNFSRRGAPPTRSRSSSAVDRRRIRRSVNDSIRSSSHHTTSSSISWFEEPQATLNGPFDAPVAIVTRQTSTTSTIRSGDTDDILVAYHQATASIQSSLSSSSNAKHHYIRPGLAASDRGHLHSRSNSSTFESIISSNHSQRAGSEQAFYHGGQGRSWGASNRSPSRSTSKNGRRVLRKKSLQVS